jgi:hypothetical protein
VKDSSVFNNVSVLGKTFLNQTLDVSGNTSLWSQLFVNGSSVFNNVSVLGKTTLIGDSNIVGNTILYGKLNVIDKSTLGLTEVTGLISMNRNVSILSDTTIDTNLTVGSTLTTMNASVKNQTTLNNLVVYGNAVLNGPTTINNTAILDNLRVLNTTILNGSSITFNANNIDLTGNINVTGGNIFKVNGNLEVDTLTYKFILNKNTSAQSFTGGQAINQIEIADFIDPSGITLNNMRGYATFKTDVNFRNSPSYQSTVQFGQNGNPVNIVTYSSGNSITLLNGNLNVNTSSYDTGGFDYTGPFAVRGSQLNIYSTTTNISSSNTNIQGTINIFNQLRIRPGGSLMIDSPNVSLIDLQKVVQLSSQLNVSNNGTGPAIRASQASPQFAEIMLLEADGLDVYSVGEGGDTQVKGKIRLGYDVVSSSNTNVNNVSRDIQLLPSQTPFLDYQLDVSGSCIISKDLTLLRDLYTGRNVDVNGNMSVNGKSYMNDLLTLKNDLTSYSDRRIKKNIKPLEHCLDKITTIHGYTFQRIDRDDEKYFIGMIAQEIEEPFPELVTEFEEKGTTIKTVNYPAFTSVLLECIQELKERIILLENKIFG